MGVLDQISELRKRGTPEEEIISHLRRQGISPREINDSLDHSKIKRAVTAEEREEGMEPSIMRPEKAEALPIDRSIPDEDLEPPAPSHFIPPHVAAQEVQEEEYVPQPIEESAQQEYYSPQEPAPPTPSPSVSQDSSAYDYQQNNYYDTPTEYYPPENYEQAYEPNYAAGGYNSGYSTNTGDTDTMIEISEQVFSEKAKTIQKHIQEFNEFKSLMESKVENMSDRLKRIESVMDKLQTSILEKIGHYGSGLETVRKELEMVQESFGKVVNDLADRAEHKHHTHHTTHQSHTPTHTTHTIHKKTTVHHKSSGRKKSSKK